MEYYDVSSWVYRSSMNTKGTRDKSVLLKPGTEDEYFIKFPMKKEGRDYSMETWSEILAYEIGKLLGFNVLRYDFGMFNDRAGCISKNMVSGQNESLIEGDSILMAYDPTYDPNDKGSYNRYTFSFVLKALEKANLSKYSEDFVRILIFDAIIGNSDRHQSNWGFIQKVKPPKQKFFNMGKKTNDIDTKMAPIYDNGCCLGREFGEEQIKERLNDTNKFNSYIHKGCAELRIGEKSNKKKNHFELLKSISNCNNNWKVFIVNEVKRIIKLYNKENITKVVSNIDSPLPEKIKINFGLSNLRKEFVVKVIDSRIKELKNIS